MIDLDRLIEKANELPPFPATTVQLTQLVASPDCNLDDVTDLIAYDMTLTVHLLRAANSAGSASATRVVTVRDAVARLGTSQVMTFAVAVGARFHLQGSVPAYGLESGALWRHSVASAVAAETAHAFCGVSVPPEAFTAALLHDAGKVVMDRFLTPDALRYIAEARAVDKLSQLEAESLILGVNHGELGALVAQHWDLPPRIVQGIMYHHNPEKGDDVVCDLTYLSNKVAHRIEAGLDHRRVGFTFLPAIAPRLSTTSAKLDNLCPVAASRYAQVSKRYNAA